MQALAACMELLGVRLAPDNTLHKAKKVRKFFAIAGDFEGY